MAYVAGFKNCCVVASYLSRSRVVANSYNFNSLEVLVVESLKTQNTML
ncbi:hypothetical protein NIES21_56200 [Anabaenopsis circularis NIES-21]|uniref:Uncharacterized protein n=1 Tax=Anabaenopsis circularis NIES-21 TaxID=1085406 RepID=A0A1Z4GQG4_9CYAN|nr:hypothetical protein NIES21_56200 [Anabaenopsis circularis NIES-21]